MIHFEVGQIYKVQYLSRTARAKYGAEAGTLQIVGINRDETQEWEAGCVRDCYGRHAGTIEYVLNTPKSHNGKVKTETLYQSKNSEEFAKHFCRGHREYEWFLPAKRDYYCVMSDEKYEV